jgi:ABC-type antimicrobial peptide transport system permease subunit
MALGAQTGQVLRMVLGKGLQLALLGGVLGVAGAMAVVPLLGSVAAELPARDPTAIVVLAMSLIAVALFACWLPARRAARLDPMVALRSE